MDTKVLRQKILDLAIRGKLVPQDSNDEPASVLLERIREQKKQMVKEGKLKAKDIKDDSVIFVGEDNLHYEKFTDGSIKCIEDEIPFELPEGWAWTRISTVALFIGGYAYKSSKYIPDSQNILIRIGNIKNNSINPFVAKTCISDEYAAETDSYLIRENDILFTMTGTRGKRDYFYSCKIEKRDLEGLKLFLNQRVGCLRLVSTADILPSYFVNAIQSSSVLEAIFATETGNVNQGNIGSTATLNLLIPVAPTEEQYKIQEKSLSILSAIEQYDIDTEDLTTIINKTRTKILDLAIRGQLVPQNPDDEPASVLLERIRREKEELIKQGKIKRDKKESIIFKGEDNSYYEKIGKTIKCIDAEIFFEIPNSWLWCRLDSIGNWQTGSTPSRRNDEYYGGNIPWIKTGDLNNGYIIDVPEYITEKALNETAVKLIPADTVLIAMYGATIGKVGITTCEATTNQACCACCNPCGVLPEYLFYYLQSQKKNFINMAEGGAQPNISKEKIVATLIPVPPFEQQTQIINKIKIFNKHIESIEKSLN